MIFFIIIFDLTYTSRQNFPVQVSLFSLSNGYIVIYWMPTMSAAVIEMQLQSHRKINKSSSDSRFWATT